MKKASFIATKIIALGLAFALAIPVSASAATSWTLQEGSSPLLWTSIASSSDGKKLAGVVYAGSVYTSDDYGVTWKKRTTANRQWTAITSSSDGTRLAATVNGGDIWTSTDSGATWVIRDEDNRFWTSITSSSDGTRLAATVLTTGLLSTGRVWTSVDSGKTWKARADAGDRLWSDIASSSNGTRLVATVNPGNIYTSSNSGASWSVVRSAGSKQWSSVASSADGLKLAAVADNGGIFTSTDGGESWQESFGEKKAWKSIASNSDGTRLAAVVGLNVLGQSGSIWTSADSGETWTQETDAGSRAWTTVAISDPVSPAAISDQVTRVSDDVTRVSDAVTRIVAAGSGVRVWTGYVEPLTVTYEFYLGETEIPFSVSTATVSGGILSNPSVPQVPGFIFLGWYNENFDEVVFPYTHQQTSNFTLRGFFLPEFFTVTYESLGNVLATTTTAYRGVLSAPANPAPRTSYTFLGWFDENDDPVTFPYTHGQIDSFTLYAGWTANPLTVSFDSAGGTSVAAVTTNGARQIILPSAPTRPGYNFNGWFTASSGGNSLPESYVIAETSNFTLYAQWTAKPLTVTYETYGGTPVASSSTTADGTLSAPARPAKTGYTFNYWATSESPMAMPLQFPYSHGQTSSFTLYAVFSQNLLSVSLDTTGGSPVANVTTFTGQALTEPATPTRSGYTFKGWYTARSGGSAATFPYTHGKTANFKLFAQWEANLTVLYSTDGGSAVANGSVTAGQTLADPGVPTRSGYNFNGWFVAATGGNPISFPYVHGQTSSFKLYAQWTAIPIFSKAPTSVVNTAVKSVSAIQYATVTNTGRANLLLGGVNLVGNDASEFTVVSNTCTNATVLPNATCRIGYRFAPLAAGARTAAFEVFNLSTNENKDVIINGFGTTAAVTINSVSTNDLSLRGGQRIIVSGSNIAKSATVTIGGTKAQVAAYSLTGSTATLTIVTPRRTAGAAPLIVTNPDTGSATYTGLIYQ